MSNPYQADGRPAAGAVPSFRAEPGTAPVPVPAPEKPKDTRSNAELRADIISARSELAQTLDALEHKLDVPARSKDFVDNSTAILKRAWDDNPLLVVGIVAGAAVAVGGAVFGAIALLRGR